MERSAGDHFDLARELLLARRHELLQVHVLRCVRRVRARRAATVAAASIVYDVRARRSEPFLGLEGLSERAFLFWWFVRLSCHRVDQVWTGYLDRLGLQPMSCYGALFRRFSCQSGRGEDSNYNPSASSSRRIPKFSQVGSLEVRGDPFEQRPNAHGRAWPEASVMQICDMYGMACAWHGTASKTVAHHAKSVAA